MSKTSKYYKNKNNIVHFIDNDSVQMTRFPGGYLSRGGSAYYYLTDYQGNNIAVVDAAGAITQRTDYYPYGEPWRYPTGQPYLFSDKELTRADGRHAYTFPARTLLPSLPRWSTPDPLAEQTPWDSPYAYCAANPIANIDPTGLKFTPESAEFLSYYESNLESYKLQFRVLTALSQRDSPSYTRFQSNYNELIAAEAELNVLKESDTEYHINVSNSPIVSGKENAFTCWNPETNRVELNLQTKAKDLFAHEMKHAYQFEIGNISFGIQGVSKSNGFYDFYDEQEAYRRYECFGTSVDVEEVVSSKLTKAAPMGWKQNFKGTTDRAILQNYSDTFIIFFKADGVVFIPSNYTLQKQ